MALTGAVLGEFANKIIQKISESPNKNDEQIPEEPEEQIPEELEEETKKEIDLENYMDYAFSTLEHE